MMKGKKLLSVLLACTIGASGMSMSAFAALDPNDYPSICTELVDAAIRQKLYKETCLDISRYSGYYNINVDMSAVTFSELYYAYDFYKVQTIENRFWQIIFENDEIIGLSCSNIVDGNVYVQVMFGGYEYIAAGLENDAHILFGSAVVEGFPCGLFCIDGIIYTDAADVLGEGQTDLIFGEIPYSKELGGMVDENDTPVVTITTTTPVEYVPMTGDVNMDGKVSLSDIVLVNRFTAGAIQLNEAQIDAADCCADGFINTSDITVLLQYILEFVDTLPVIPE